MSARKSTAQIAEDNRLARAASVECQAFAMDWLSWHEPTMLDALDRPLHCPIAGCNHEYRPIDGLQFETTSAHVRCPECHNGGEWLIGGMAWNPRGMLCGFCGRDAETAPFMQRRQIGLIVMRLYSEDRRMACAPCMKRHFRTMTGMTFLFGWWGIISLFVTPFVLISNLVDYLGRDKSAGQPVPGWIDSRIPEDARAALAAHENWALEQLGVDERKESALDIGTRMGELAGVSRIYAMLYLSEKMTHRMRTLLGHDPEPGA